MLVLITGFGLAKVVDEHVYCKILQLLQEEPLGRKPGREHQFRCRKMATTYQPEEVGGERETTHVQPHRWKFYWC